MTIKGDLFSSCCSAHAFVSGSEEGTNYYYCDACKKPCDVKFVGEAYTPMVGDRISLEGEIIEKRKGAGDVTWLVRFGPIQCEIDMYQKELEEAKAKLLSRKPPRKITRKEIEEMVGGSFELID